MLAVAYATARASHARQVKGDDPDKKGYPGPQGWGLGVRLTTPPVKKILLRNLKRTPRPTQGCRANDDDDGLAVHIYIYMCTARPAILLFYNVQKKITLKMLCISQLPHRIYMHA
jgi:hypothetical protein